MEIKFNQPYSSKNELKYIKDVISSKETSADMKYTKKVQTYLKNKIKSEKIIMTNSATAALEIAIKAVKISDGDEVIIPNYAFPSTANCVLLSGGRVVMSEVNNDDLCLDISKIEEKITKKTKAIIPIHYGGNSVDMKRLMEIANRYNLMVIEDAAQALFSTNEDKYLGTIGDFGCFSFHQTKNISCGEGGALSVNTKNSKIVNRVYHIAQKGTNRQEFIEGKRDHYEWVEIGSSYMPSDILMAYLFSQLEEASYIQKRRKKIYLSYLDYFNSNPHPHIENYQKENKYGKSNYHTFFVTFKSNAYATYFINELKKKNIIAYPHFYPLDISKKGKEMGYDKKKFNNTIDIFRKLIRLPLHSCIDNNELEYIIDTIDDILKKGK